MSDANPNPNDPLGIDLWCSSDIDPLGREVSGADLVGQAILHRLTTGLLPLVDSEDGYIEWGEDVRLWAGLDLTEDELAARAAALGGVLERDERISTAEVTSALSADGDIWSFKLYIAATLNTGATISRVLGISSLTAELLAEGR